MSKLFRSALLSVPILIASLYVDAQYLHTEGTKIVDGDGNEVIWRGIGLGGWMLQEGYMLRTSGAQHEIEAKIEALVGQEKKEQFFEAWLANHTQKADVDSLASWGYNMIRLPMHYKQFTPPIEEEPVPGEITWRDKGFEMTDELLEWCNANKMYLILDLHAAPGGQGENADISDYDPSKPSLWESEANQDKMVALWRKLAERYANEPMLAAYDIINEPNWGFQDHANDLNGCAESQNTLLWSLQKRVTAAIREVDQNHIVVIEGNCWGNNYNGLPTLWDNNLVISYHKYWNGNNKNDIQGMLNMRTDRNVPIWLGETGENSNTWFTNAVSLLESNGIGWAWWPLKKLGGNNPLQIKVNPGYQKILDYWGGNGTKPEVDEAYEGLMGLAENLKLENNVYHRDVVDAKIRQPHTDATLPFKPHVISPNQQNIVHFTDFDLGKSGFAYGDTEVTNTTGNAGGQAWNLGYAYRNDGVDIEESADESEWSNGYNVGWTADGEWMKYTVSVDSSGAYDLTVRYAGQAAGIVHVEVDGVDVTGSISLEATGGYQVWQDKVLKDVPLLAGTREVRFVIDKGGTNLSYLGFFLIKKISDLSFKAVSATTDMDGLVILTLNKELNASTVTKDGFTAKVNGTEVTAVEVTYLDTYELLIDLAQSLIDTDDVLLSYDGSGIMSADGSALEGFTDVAVANTLPYHAPIPGRIEAEDFVVNAGLELESTTDTGGGQNIGYTNTGDYLDYNVVVKTSGDYQIEVRVACDNNEGKIRFEQLDADGKVLNEGIVDVPLTGGWQTWQTVSGAMYLHESRGTLRLSIVDPEFNVNWFQFSKMEVLSSPGAHEVMLYPNPARNVLNVRLAQDQSEGGFRLLGLDGKVLIDRQVKNDDLLNLSHLPDGVYISELSLGEKVHRRKILINK